MKFYAVLELKDGSTIWVDVPQSVPRTLNGLRCMYKTWKKGHRISDSMREDLGAELVKSGRAKFVIRQAKTSEGASH